ncbi:hypothetical protein MKX70_16770 [Paenibacillus sp. FSL R7-0312]|uniref:hypothetical protein n=1 Tax=Paenibacillus sp. FSL R7-0312 TaxID=2921682 RepID=UPI0030FB5855
MITQYEIKQTYNVEGLLFYLAKRAFHINASRHYFVDLTSLSTIFNVPEKTLKQVIDWNMPLKNQYGVAISEDNKRTVMLRVDAINILLSALNVGLEKSKEIKILLQNIKKN